MKEEFTQQEIMELLGVSRQMVWKYENEGLLTSKRMGRKKIYMSDSKLELLLQEKKRISPFQNHEKRIRELEIEVQKLKEMLISLHKIDINNVNQTSNSLHNNVNQTSNSLHNNVNQTSNSLHNNVNQTSNSLHNNVNQTSNSLHETVISEMKATIQRAIDEGIHKSKINPKGKGSQLGKWLKGESSPSFQKIEEWHKKSLELLDKKS